MNTIKALVLLTLITCSCKASTFTKMPSDDTKPLYEQMQRFINRAPEIKIYDEIIVTVKFRLNADNKIIIISDDSDNYKIKKLIKTSLNLKELTTDKDSNKKVYYISVRFLPTVD